MELSTLIRRGGVSGINFADQFNAGGISTMARTARGTSGTLINLTGKGVVTLFVEPAHSSTGCRLTIDGVLWGVTDLRWLGESCGVMYYDGTGKACAIPINFESSINIEVFHTVTEPSIACTYAIS